MVERKCQWNTGILECWILNGLVHDYVSIVPLFQLSNLFRVSIQYSNIPVFQPSIVPSKPGAAPWFDFGLHFDGANN
jgi:hypothetical protein